MELAFLIHICYPLFQQHFGYWIKDHMIFKLFCVIHQYAISASSFEFNCTLSTSEFIKMYLPVTFQQADVIVHPIFLFSSICVLLDQLFLFVNME